MAEIDKKILRKIAKCLALSASPEPAEAAAAMRQAQKLMEKYGVSEADVQMADVGERGVSIGRSNQRPPSWITLLASTVCTAFGVSRYYVSGYFDHSKYVFIGIEPALSVAEYSFTVLRRKCAAARLAYYRKLRGKRINRIRKADVYARGWVSAVQREVERFAQPVPKPVQVYMERKSKDLVPIQAINRGNGERRDLDHFINGRVDGGNVSLQHGVAAISNPQLEGVKQ